MLVGSQMVFGDANHYPLILCQRPHQPLAFRFRQVLCQMEFHRMGVSGQFINEGTDALLISHAEHGNFAGRRFQGEHPATVAQHRDGSQVQPVNQVARLRCVQAVLQPREPDAGFAFQPEGILIHQHLAASCRNLALGEFAALHRRKYRLHLLFESTGHQQQVVACLQSLQADTLMGRNTLHGKCIRKHQPPETQFVFQQTGNNLRRERSGQSLPAFEGRNLQMAHHNATQPRPDDLLKGIQFHTIQTYTSEVQHRQRLMGVHVCVAVSREVLAHGEHTAVFQPFGIRHHLARHVLRVLAERAGVDDGILRIDVHIRHRRKVHLHTHLAALPRHFATVFIEQAAVADAAQHPVPGKRGSAAQAHRQPPFAIESNHQRNFRQLLRLVRQHRLIRCQPARKEQTAHFVVLHHVVQQVLVRLVLGGGNGIDEELPDTFFQAETLQHRVCPLPATGIVLGQQLRVHPQVAAEAAQH